MSFEFKFARNFSGLTQDDYDDAYDEIFSRFAGVDSMWAILDSTMATSKRVLCYNYLVAWYLCDMFPSKVIGVDADGRPVSSKSIGGTSVSMLQIGKSESSLQELSTNTFGLKAKGMILSSPEMMGIYG
jgi:hypothetical protein